MSPVEIYFRYIISCFTKLTMQASGNTGVYFRTGRFAKGILCRKLHHLLLHRTSYTHTHTPIFSLLSLHCKGIDSRFKSPGLYLFRAPSSARALNSDRGESPFDNNWEPIEYHAGREHADIPFHIRAEREIRDINSALFDERTNAGVTRTERSERGEWREMNATARREMELVVYLSRTAATRS